MNEDEIKEIRERQEETLAIVQKLWRAEKMRRWAAAARYIIYIGVLLGFFYFITPYLEKSLMLIGQFQNIIAPQDLQKLLEQSQLLK